VASKKKAVVEVQEEPKKIRFTKAQLVSSKKYRDRKDLLNVLLKDDATYGFDDVDELIEQFMKGKVK